MFSFSFFLSSSQLDGGPPKRLAKEKVGDVLKRMDERGKMDEISTSLDLNHLHNRKCGKLSGGEIQRLAVACTCLQNREVYMFDEPSAFLDIRQRINVMGVIRSLLDEDDGKMEDEKTEDGEGEDATKSSNKTRRDRVSRKVCCCCCCCYCYCCCCCCYCCCCRRSCCFSCLFSPFLQLSSCDERKSFLTSFALLFLLLFPFFHDRAVRHRRRPRLVGA